MNKYNGLKVYVPNAKGISALSFIHKGSAIVSNGVADAEGFVTVYYEGNIYGAQNIRTFEDKAVIAAGRLAERYPTVARARVMIGHLTLVGDFHSNSRPALNMNSLPIEMRYLPRSVLARMLPPNMRKNLSGGTETVCRITGHNNPDFRNWIRP